MPRTPRQSPQDPKQKRAKPNSQQLETITPTAQEPAQTPHIAVHSDPDQKRAHLGPERTLLIVRLKERNPAATHQEIADAVGVDRSVVTRTLQIFETNTVPEARKYLKAHALKAAMKIEQQVEHGDSRVSQGAAKAIIAAAGVQESSAQVSVGVQVIVGNTGQPAGPDPFETIDASVVESKS